MRGLLAAPPRRSPAAWAVAALLSALGWCALLAGVVRPAGVALTAAVVAVGGWTLSLLPVHCDPKRTAPARRAGGAPLNGSDAPPWTPSEPDPAGSADTSS
ncbi:hypothetical protein ACIQGZ_23420 [Streptomyces sp. NPDC092296]|uniref:hypothetical protein n=1 Tax=Streptomyces sp. NPDC092296 TaxID=3366012 RepID=UPI003802AFEA